MSTHTYEAISRAFNEAADAILDASQAPDTGARDAINLVVNVGLTYLQNPELELHEAIAANYELDEDDGGPLEWMLS